MEPCEGVDGIVGPSYGPSLRGRQDSNFLGTRVPILLCFQHNTGGGYLETTASILKFDPRSLSWSEVGEMTQPRFMHGASVVNAEDVGQYCVYK